MGWWSWGVVFGVSVASLGCATRGLGAPPATWGVVCADQSFEAAIARRTIEGLLDVAKRSGQPETHVTLKLTSTGFSAELHRSSGVVTQELTLAPHVLSGATWAPLAASLVGTTDTPATSLDVLASVEQSVSLSTLLTTSTAIAKELRKTPRSAALREQSALLLVVLALREAGPLIDPHEPLALATSQLAIAQALRGTTAVSTEGRAAQAVIHALAGDEGAALSALDEKGAASWMKAVRLLATGDWRQPTDAAPPLNGLERLARYRELRFRSSSIQAQDALESWTSLDDPLWARMVFTTGMHQSVVDARRYGEALPARERAETDQLRGLEDLTEVIPPDVLQRHLLRNAMSAALVKYTLFAESLSRPDLAARVYDAANREFGEDPQWAAASVLLRKAPPAADCARAKKGLDILTPSVRQVVSKRCGSPVFDADELAALTPRNTVYNADNRLQWMRVKALPTWATLAPHSFPVRAALVRVQNNQPLEAKQVLAELGPIADYDVRALSAAMTLSTGPSREVLEKRCDVDADACDELINHLREEKLPFVDVLERWRHTPRARISFSELSRPLLDAYFEQHRLDDAALLAQEVEEVGSSRGLEVAAVFAERLGRYDVAESKYRAHAQRYGRRDLLDDFYLRADHRKYPGNWQRQAAEAEQRVFGGPLQKVAKGQLSAADRGVRMGDERDPAYRHFGIQKGDLVLSLDGYRVKDMLQLLVLAHRTEATTMTVVVIRDAQLLELTGPFRRQRYGP